MKRVIKYFLMLALLVLVVLQFIRPEANADGYGSVAAFEAETAPSEEVKAILRANCYDCHSNHTEYPWYSYIAPVSYYLDDHIRHGKGSFNVSKWEHFSAKKKDHKLEELTEEVEKGTMPLDSYAWIHGELSEADSETLIQWATIARLKYADELKVSTH
ncbi:MAG: heme-binding domain-containing protein [Bacteroidota bacterium]